MKKVASVVLYLGGMLFPVCPTTLSAYDQATHQEITQRAADTSSVDRILKDELQINRGIRETFLDRQVLRLLADGSFLD